jgi:hypothetical protein
MGELGSVRGKMRDANTILAGKPEGKRSCLDVDERIILKCRICLR